jgi:hypothetical protein
MGPTVKASAAADRAEVDAEACALTTPLLGRVPGLLALAAVPATLLLNPWFFGLAGGLLATISLLLSPPRCRMLGTIGLLGALAAGLYRLLY